MENKNVMTPKRFGILLTIFGFVLFCGGIQLLLLGDNFYFVIIGLGIMFSGIFIRKGRKIGAYCFLVTFSFITAWSIIEIGFNYQKLLPRLLLPFFLCCYIFSNNILSKLD